MPHHIAIPRPPSALPALIYRIGLALVCLFPHALPAQEAFSHRLLDDVLSAHVNGQGLVDYVQLKANRDALDAYIEQLATVSPQSHPALFPTPPHALAYWINAYNALVLRGVVDAYPVTSVKEIALFNGFFNRQQWNVGGRALTLDQLENEIIRPQFKDPRIHFVLNCGALSCPPLPNRAFDSATLDETLEHAARRFAGNDKYLRIEGEVLFLSKILDWYGQDFRDWFPDQRANTPARHPLVNYFIPLLEGERAQQVQKPHLELAFMPYDWRLNEQPPPPLTPLQP